MIDSPERGAPVLQRESAKNLRFGVFEVDFVNAELRKHGLRVRLQEQPFRVLTALLERPGQIVTREDLIRRLWMDGSVVDFDRGLNAAVTRLRQALSDSADVPRYVETVARKGYRFVGSIQPVTEPEPPAAAKNPRRVWTWAAGIPIFVIALAGAWWSGRDQAGKTDPQWRVVPLTTGSGFERNASFSPDGSQIAYEWLRDDGTRHLYIRTVGGGDPTPLTSGPAEEYGPAWSPDGRLIAFLRRLGESTMGLFVVPPLGGGERRVAETAPPPYWVLQRLHRRLDWTRDSRHVIVSVPERAGGGEGLLLVSVENGQKTWLTKPSGNAMYGDREPTVSPDGDAVAFARGEAGANDMIHLLPLATDLQPAGPVRRLESAGSARSPVWMPDGKRIIYTTINPGVTFGSGVWEIGLNRRDKPRELVALGRNAAVVAVAKSGRLAYSQVVMNGVVWRQEIPVDGAAILSPVKVTESSALDFNAQYSPDGNRIVFASNRSGSREIWTCEQDGRHCLQITKFNLFLTGSPRWSPDGEQIAFDCSAAGRMNIYVAPSWGGSAQRLTDDTTDGIIPSWSHDGKWIYFSSSVTGRNEIWKIPSSGGKAVQVTRNGGLVALDSPDGRSLYYTKTEERTTLFRSDTDGNGETPVLGDVAKRGFVIAADRIYYLCERRGTFSIRRLMLRSHEDSPVAPVRNSVYLGLSLSRDGRSLMYSDARAQGNLMLAEGSR